MTLLEQLREIGLAMGGRYAAVEVPTEDEAGEKVTAVYQRYVGWTTDEAKADAAANSRRVHPRLHGQRS